MKNLIINLLFFSLLYNLQSCSSKLSPAQTPIPAQETKSTSPPVKENNIPIATPAVMHEPLMMDTEQPKPVPANTLPMEKVKDK